MWEGGSDKERNIEAIRANKEGKAQMNNAFSTQ